MSDLSAVETWIGDLVAKLGPGERAQLARAVARDLRAANQDRIRRQVTPDGEAFAPRKPRLRDQRGAVRRRARPMFRGLRMARFMASGGDAAEAWVGFAGLAARIARVHQEGLEDSVDRRDPDAPRVRYAARPLLGITDADRERIAEAALKHLSPD